MNTSSIVSQIDQEIERLQSARRLLTGGAHTPAAATTPSKRGPGRPRMAGHAAPAAKKAGKKRRTMSAEGRMKIAEAQRKRWAEKKATVAS